MTDSSLIRYDAACRALAAARTTDDAKKIRNHAEAVRAYARQAKNRALEIDAAEIRIRAERRLGELLSEQKASVGLNKGAAGKGPGRGKRKALVIDESLLPTLKEAGIDHDLSSRSQRLAKIPDKTFERLVDSWRTATEEKATRVSTQLLRGGSPRQAVPADTDGEASAFRQETAILRVINAIRGVAVDWPVTLNIEPFVAAIRREADRQMRRAQERQAS